MSNKKQGNRIKCNIRIIIFSIYNTKNNFYAFNYQTGIHSIFICQSNKNPNIHQPLIRTDYENIGMQNCFYEMRGMILFQSKHRKKTTMKLLMRVYIGKLLKLLELLRASLILRALIFASVNSLESNIDSNIGIFIVASSKK